MQCLTSRVPDRAGHAQNADDLNASLASSLWRDAHVHTTPVYACTQAHERHLIAGIGDPLFFTTLWYNIDHGVSG